MLDGIAKNLLIFCIKPSTLKCACCGQLSKVIFWPKEEVESVGRQSMGQV
jgi:hypothetical protein